MNGMPPRGIWSDEKYRFGMIELQPVLGLVAGGWVGGGKVGGGVARMCVFGFCVCVCTPPDRVGASLG